MTTRTRAAWTVGIAAVLFIVLCTQASLAQLPTPQTPLPGKNIPKYVDPLPTFMSGGAPDRVNGTQPLTVTMKEFQQQVLPAAQYPVQFTLGTYVWGYEIADPSRTYPKHYPGYTVEAQQGTPTSMTYINDLVNPLLQQYLPVDQTLHWADPLETMLSMDRYTGPVPTVVHLHGGEVPSAIDGGPDAWFTPNSQGPPAYTGPAYNQTVNGAPVANTYVYPNVQEPATLWFHDHALGATRLNVYAGLAAFYLLRGPGDSGPAATPFPAGPYEIEVAIQDRMFDTNGQLYFPHLGINPTIHPFWIPEFFGDVIVVNGKSWPFMNVEPRRYRFRLLNGSNARFYDLSLGKGGPTIYQIGTDGGLLDAPVAIVYPNRLLLAPGERADVIIDFTKFAGKTILMDNTAKAPYPAGAAADPQTVGQIMQFRVVTPLGLPDGSFDPATGGNLRPNGALVKLVNFTTGTPAVTPNVTRKLTLNEVMGMAGPREILVNNTKWDGALSPNAGGVTELPMDGSTELWEIINLTADAHPMHLHLVQFQLVNRQDLQTNKYLKAYGAAFPAGTSPVDQVTYPGGVYIPGYGPPLPYNPTPTVGYVGGNPDPTPFLQGKPTPANPNERGWKDTFKMFPGQVTRVLVRFAPTTIAANATTPGSGPGIYGTYFSFDPTEGPGYVWHCHIVDHEDNEMMRPYKVIPGTSASIVATNNPSLKAATVSEKPLSFGLDQNYPNPFNPTTEIRFSLPEDAHVTMRLYNTLGQEVQTLIDADAPAGNHTVKLDAGRLASGMYIYKIQAGSYTASRTMVVMK
jgi:spore coat protein A, manganese oxidase